MDSSFSKALELSGANSTTTYILWSMIIFLLILVGGIAFVMVKQLKKSKSFENKEALGSKRNKFKGF